MVHFKNMSWKIDDIYAGVIGLIGGIVAYMKFDLLRIDWGHLGTSLLQLLWTCFIAFLSAAAGVIGKKLVEKYWHKNKKDK